jgi:hypothetical protein
MLSNKDKAIAWGITRKKIIATFHKNSKPLDNGCIEWTKSVNENGYGNFGISISESGRPKPCAVYAHRFAWALKHGIEALPLGIGRLGTGDRLVLNHICHNRKCVNTDHLEPIMHSENISPKKKKPKNG